MNTMFGQCDPSMMSHHKSSPVYHAAPAETVWGGPRPFDGLGQEEPTVMDWGVALGLILASSVATGLMFTLATRIWPPEVRVVK